MNNFKYILLFLSLFCISLVSNAEQVYEKVDKQGVPSFSDQATPGAEKIDVKPNVVHQKPASPEPATAQHQEKKSSAKQTSQTGSYETDGLSRRDRDERDLRRMEAEKHDRQHAPEAPKKHKVKRLEHKGIR